MNTENRSLVGGADREISPSKGGASRAAILLTAAKLATTRGFNGLSIGDLAAEVGMSKSGLYAHFKSKEELELATIATAAEIFQREVLQPAMSSKTGTERLRALVQAFLAHLERQVFPGGCFFAAVAMELDTRPGPVRDAVFEVQGKWVSLLKQCFVDAQSQGEIDDQANIAQALFETQAMLLAANFLFVMTNELTALTQATQGVENVLARLTVPAGVTKKKSPRGKA